MVLLKMGQKTSRTPFHRLLHLSTEFPELEKWYKMRTSGPLVCYGIKFLCRLSRSLSRLSRSLVLGQSDGKYPGKDIVTVFQLGTLM